MSRRILQTILIVIGLVALVSGFLGLYSGVDDPFYGLSGIDHPGGVILDSNMRYFSGVWLGVGLALFWVARSVEKQTNTLRLLAIMIFIGGVGRVISIIDAGAPSTPFLFFTFLEVSFPALLLWQNRMVANRI